jgi:hypothetical protein
MLPYRATVAHVEAIMIKQRIPFGQAHVRPSRGDYELFDLIRSSAHGSG